MDHAHTSARYLEPKFLFVNQHDGTFRNVSKLVGEAIQIPQVSRGLAVGDLFNDGRMEAVVENLVGQPMMLALPKEARRTIGSVFNSKE